ncbi:Peptidase S33 tripeptidyl aminopeptidase-like, C-terminal [Phaffia rhodozyma]|uniref:Peptidase S33 tripeptidyl aminopeptidase-like, C-terminal n=1 Tax=Phaffia rhodozyma TaxID=264483 RepID=A0A0F7SMT6_PHARH|nr:Peptidase S33 tripeptidyl aminopeptidase-like, C-terminal [Phaffia rhodozyma]
MFTQHPSARDSGSLRTFSLVLFLFSFCELGSAASVPHVQSLATSSFGDVQWHACPEAPNNPRFQCTTVKVPLDYTQGWEAGEAQIAVNKWVAQGPKHGDERKSLFVNPGGPGGAGTMFTYEVAAPLSEVIDDMYDIIGFDPRGINNTTPKMLCFPNQQTETLYQASLGPTVDPWVGREELRRMIGKADAENMMIEQMCEASSQEAGRHMSTTTVVRDLAFLAELFTGRDTPINYYGVSYGSVIGEFLIGMFPDRVGNVVIDGICDPITWRENAHHTWSRRDLLDTDKTYMAFLRSCIDAGQERCALASQNSTVESLKSDIDDILKQMVGYPLVVKGMGVLYSAQVRQWIFANLFQPSGWSGLAQGNGTLIFESTQSMIELDPKIPASTTFATEGVECTDAIPYPENMTTEAIVDMLTDEMLFQVNNISSRFAGLFVDKCLRWKMRDADRFTGLMNQTLSNDILIIGNTADPITSIKNAQLLNEIQPMSRLVHHDGFGHCSYVMASLCTLSAMRSYLIENILPPNNLLCKPDQVLFPNSTEQAGLTLLRRASADSGRPSEPGETGSEETRLLSALVEIGHALDRSFARRR